MNRDDKEGAKKMSGTPSVKETEDLGRLIRSFKKNHSMSSRDEAIKDLRRQLEEVSGRLNKLTEKTKSIEVRFQTLEEVIKLLFQKTVIMNECIESIDGEMSQRSGGRS